MVALVSAQFPTDPGLQEEKINMSDWVARMDLLSEELSRIRSDISEMKSDIREDMARARKETKSEIERLIDSDRAQDVQIAKLEVQASVWGAAGGVIATAVTLGAALLARLFG